MTAILWISFRGVIAYEMTLDVIKIVRVNDMQKYHLEALRRIKNFNQVLNW